VNSGDLSQAEALLMAQAVTLNTVFTSLANQAGKADRVDLLERYLRLALKAQTQSRATLETLAAIKNPPTVFAKQANISHGHQQVNNALVTRGDNQPAPNRLLEPHVERMDNCEAGKTGDGDSALAAMGTVVRPEDTGRQGAICEERLQGGSAPSVAGNRKGLQRGASGKS
jgi:hypothetical protein